MLKYVSIALLVIGGLGVCWQCVVFVRKTLPENYGSNPGFGCLETKVLPWHVITTIGAGMMLKSWSWGIGILVLGIFGYGLIAMLLGKLFGGK